jgi:ABC-2 type transport system ATP-binding protein
LIDFTTETSVAPPLRRAPPAAHIVELREVEKSFPVQRSLLGAFRGQRRRTVLHDVTFDIHAGELFGLLGPNGAGKTTLLKMLATLLYPDKGRISLGGFDVVRQPLEAKRRIGLCSSEERSFYFRLTARENLEYFGAMVGLRGTLLRRRIREVADVVNLGDVLDRRFDAFSSGMRQRLTVARALLADPPILLFDEPTRAVDPVNADEIRRLIRDELVRVRGKTVVLATNLLHEAWDLADRIAVVNNGTIVALNTPKALVVEFHQVARYHVRLNGSSELICDLLSEIRGVQSLDLVRGANGTEIDLRIEPSVDSLREMMRILSLPEAEVCEFRSIEPEPMEVFKHVTRTTGTQA